MKDIEVFDTLVKAILNNRAPRALRAMSCPSGTEFVFLNLVKAAKLQAERVGGLDGGTSQYYGRLISNIFIKINQFRIKNWFFKEVEYKR